MSYRDAGSNRRLFPSGVRARRRGLPASPTCFSPSKWPVEPELHPLHQPSSSSLYSLCQPSAVAVLREPRLLPLVQASTHSPWPLVQRRNSGRAPPSASCRALWGHVVSTHSHPGWGLSELLSDRSYVLPGWGGGVLFPGCTRTAHSQRAQDRDTRSPHLSSVTGSHVTLSRTVTVCARICPIAR